MCSCAHLPQFKSLRLCECFWWGFIEQVWAATFICCCIVMPDDILLWSVVSADKFQYTCKGGDTNSEGVDDSKDMEETLKTFSLLGKNTLSVRMQLALSVTSTLLSPLFLSRVEGGFPVRCVQCFGGHFALGKCPNQKLWRWKIISSRESHLWKPKCLFCLRGSWCDTQLDLHIFQPGDPHLAFFCELLSVSAEGLTRWLCNRRIVLVAETVVKPEPIERAVNARDALAKQIYAHLFDCIIKRINNALQAPGQQHAFIGVLDIYG